MSAYRITGGIILSALMLIAVLLMFSAGSAYAGTGGCIIGIEKEAFPDDDTLFTFEVTGDQTGQFQLQDPSDDIHELQIAVDVTITVTELVPDGWTLTDISCEEGIINCGAGEFVPCLSADVVGDSVVLTCLDNDMGQCRFTNVRDVQVSSVPTITEWGLVAMAAVLGFIGFMAVRRRSASVS